MPATPPEASVLVALGLWHVCRCVSARILVSLLLLPVATAQHCRGTCAAFGGASDPSNQLLYKHLYSCARSACYCWLKRNQTLNDLRKKVSASTECPSEKPSLLITAHWLVLTCLLHVGI